MAVPTTSTSTVTHKEMNNEESLSLTEDVEYYKENNIPAVFYFLKMKEVDVNLLGAWRSLSTKEK